MSTAENKLLLGQLMQDYADAMDLNQLEGSAATAIPGVSFYRASKGSQRQPLLYQSGLIIMGQGEKVVYLGDRSVSYGPGKFLVLGVPLPLECEAKAVDDKPILGLSINIEPQVLQQLAGILQNNSTELIHCDAGCGLESDDMPEAMFDAVIRLLRALKDKTESYALGEQIVKEIIFRVLRSNQRKVLLGLAQHNGHYSRIARSLTTLHSEYAKKLTVDELAADANLSVSAFHRVFKQVTLESPLQYLKKVRLSKARDLIVQQGKKANEAAYEVGYTSTTQFSREFKRHFSYSPGQSI